MHSNDVYGEETLEETCVHSIQYPMRSYELGRLRGTAKAPKGPRSLHWPQRGHCYFLYCLPFNCLDSRIARSRVGWVRHVIHKRNLNYSDGGLLFFGLHQYLNT